MLSEEQSIFDTVMSRQVPHPKKLITGSTYIVFTPATFIIADRQNLFIEGLTRIIQEKCSHSQVVGAYTVAELIDCLEKYSPQTIFLNYIFIDQHFHLIRPVLADKGYPEIVAICDTNSDEARKRAASIGAQCIIDKNVSVETIWNLMGDQHGDDQKTGTLNKSISKNISLTTRQQRILGLLARGMTNREISNSIGCAENTVKVHLNNAYKILGVKNRTQAMCAVSKVAPLKHIA